MAFEVRPCDYDEKCFLKGKQQMMNRFFLSSERLMYVQFTSCVYGEGLKCGCEGLISASVLSCEI